MITKKILIAVMLSSIFNYAYCQDTAILYFKNQQLLLNNQKSTVGFIDTLDASNDTLIYSKFGKFIYFKYSKSDSSLTTFGQLGCHKIGNKIYLLREGQWIVEGVNIFFENTITLGYPEELPISTNANRLQESIEYLNRLPAKSKRKIKKVKHN
jgi:hypothetical protein